MDCTLCGVPIILDIISEEETAWCPKCGKDYSYEYYEAAADPEPTEIERCVSRNKVPSVSRDKV